MTKCPVDVAIVIALSLSEAALKPIQVAVWTRFLIRVHAAMETLVKASSSGAIGCKELSSMAWLRSRE